MPRIYRLSWFLLLFAAGLPLLASAATDSIPEPAEVVFLGEEGQYAIEDGSSFIVKRIAPLRFVLVPGPTYTAVTGERVWAISGENQTEPLAIRKTRDLGQVPSGCEVSYVGIDDDVDDRFGNFKLNDVIIHTIPQGMVFSGEFIVPSTGNLMIEEADSIGLWLSLCENLTPPPTTPPPTTPPPTTPPPTTPPPTTPPPTTPPPTTPPPTTPPPTPPTITPTPTDTPTPPPPSSAFHYMSIISGGRNHIFVPISIYICVDQCPRSATTGD